MENGESSEKEAKVTIIRKEWHDQMYEELTSAGCDLEKTRFSVEDFEGFPKGSYSLYSWSSPPYPFPKEERSGTSCVVTPVFIFVKHYVREEGILYQVNLSETRNNDEYIAYKDGVWAEERSDLIAFKAIYPDPSTAEKNAVLVAYFAKILTYTARPKAADKTMTGPVDSVPAIDNKLVILRKPLVLGDLVAEEEKQTAERDRSCREYFSDNIVKILASEYPDGKLPEEAWK